VEIYLAPEEVRELALQAEEPQTRDVTLLELDQDVHVTLRPEVLAEDRPEQG